MDIRKLTRKLFGNYRETPSYKHMTIILRVSLFPYIGGKPGNFIKKMETARETTWKLKI